MFSRPTKNFIVVDGSYRSKTNTIQYRIMDGETGTILFESGPLPSGTNNLAEFLALTAALIYCKKQKLSKAVYSDSVTALSWVRWGRANTDRKAIANTKSLELLEKSEKWLAQNTKRITPRKWETEWWGENPADYGFKGKKKNERKKQ